MGKYKDGIAGSFSGKVGPVVGVTWKGIKYMRSLPRPSKNSPSLAQQNQRDKVSLAGSFMQSIKEIVVFGFNNNVPGRSEYNSATAHFMKNAIDTTTQPYSIRYNRVLVTRGEYPGADNPSAGPGKPGEIVFGWNNDSGIGAATANDNVLLVAYSSVNNSVLFTSNQATRSMETAILNVDLFKGEIVETYIAFLKADGSDVSPSVYTGQVTVVM